LTGTSSELSSSDDSTFLTGAFFYGAGLLFKTGVSSLSESLDSTFLIGLLLIFYYCLATTISYEELSSDESSTTGTLVLTFF